MDKRASQSMNAEGAGSSDVAGIVSDISQTRASMSSTVNEIEQRLSPAHIKEQIVELKDSALGQFHEVKDHLKDDLAKEFQEAKGKIEQEMAEARARINQELEHARQAVHDATVGRMEHMVHDAKETVTEAKTTAFQVVRENPIPVALVAVGLGWLLMGARGSRSRRDGRSRAERIQQGYRVGIREGNHRFEDTRGRESLPAHSTFGDALHGAQDRVARFGHQMGDGASEVGHKVQEVGHRIQEGAVGLSQQARGAVHDVGETVGSLAHRAGENAGQLAHRVGDGAGELAHRVSDGAGQVVHTIGDGAGRLAHRVGDGAEHIAHGTRDVASHLAHDASRVGQRAYRGVESGMVRAEQGFEDAMYSNPLAVGAVALAVGAAIGLALPHTEREDDWTGEVRDRLFEQAEHAAHSALEAVEHKAQAFVGDLGQDHRGRGRRHAGV